MHMDTEEPRDDRQKNDGFDRKAMMAATIFASIIQPRVSKNGLCEAKEVSTVYKQALDFAIEAADQLFRNTRPLKP